MRIRDGMTGAPMTWHGNGMPGHGSSMLAPHHAASNTLQLNTTPGAVSSGHIHRDIDVKSAVLLELSLAGRPEYTPGQAAAVSIEGLCMLPDWGMSSVGLHESVKNYNCISCHVLSRFEMATKLNHASATANCTELTSRCAALPAIAIAAPRRRLGCIRARRRPDHGAWTPCSQSSHHGSCSV